ncbi:MAG: carboxypeptidase regulatory-like domain-containing protein [Candidatus Entotheonellia bacterium]
MYPASPKETKPIFVLLCLAAWCVVAGGTTWGGTIRGTVRFTGAAVEAKKLPVTVDHSVCGKEKDAQDIVLSPEKGIRNVVVSLQPPPPGAKWPVSKPIVQMDQEQCVFVPRVVVVPAGGTVEFLNTDRLLHNLHSDSKGNPIINRTQPRGRTIPIVFKEPEIIRVGCDLHPWMRSWVVVAEHPFYAITNNQGEFILDHVPPGEYSLQLWQESLGTVTKDVTVREDAPTTLAVEMIKK